MLSPEVNAKYEKLKGILREMGSVVVAYSGGVDSTFLLRVCYDVLGDGVLGVIAVSPTYARHEYDSALKFVQELGAPHMVIESEEMNDPDFCGNPSNRCFYCKSELFGKLTSIAMDRDIGHVLDGSNSDDCLEFRPGRKAASEKGVRSPLIEAYLTKDNIRAISRELGLPTADKPATACLASRFPYGEQITVDKLGRVEEAELFLRECGFDQVRIRSNNDTARIEVDSEKIAQLMADSIRNKVVSKLKDIGFAYVTVDLQGYRSGSMNEALDRGGTS